MDVAILWEETVTTTSGEETVPTQGSHAGWRRLWDRELHHYPESGPRVWYLALTVLATVVLYYALVVPAAIAPRVMQHFGFTFAQITWVAVIAGLAGAFASLAAGLADRWGRANLVVGGLLVTGLLMVFALPNASSKAEYTVFIAMVSMVEGVVLVATPALVRDFSPQLNRGAAMGFWTLGPVLGWGSAVRGAAAGGRRPRPRRHRRRPRPTRGAALGRHRPPAARGPRRRRLRAGARRGRKPDHRRRARVGASGARPAPPSSRRLGVAHPYRAQGRRARC